MTPCEILAAIQAELGPDRPVADLPPVIREWLLAVVLSEGATPAEAAEALTLALDLGDARDRGEISDEQGVEVMYRLAKRHKGQLTTD